jgi:hypothetical protein
MSIDPAKTAEAARSAGATIMHAPIMFAKGYNEISAHSSQIRLPDVLQTDDV